MRQWLIGLLAVAGTLWCAGWANAQNDVLDEFYGQGYHAYFRGDLGSAESYLTTAISEGSKDPRVFYLRGLTYLSQGKTVEADVDFHDGALLEAEGNGRLIGKALERIQGCNRLTLEQARRAARLEVARRRGFSPPAAQPRELPRMPDMPPDMPPSAEVESEPMIDSGLGEDAGSDENVETEPFESSAPEGSDPPATEFPESSEDPFATDDLEAEPADAGTP
ncbi:MAG: hypothetical protein O2931_04770 [Planctomycetota bacterium]|nr:hypothetical protein [Planctomycetota bacterium]